MAKLDQALSYFHDRVSDCIKSGKDISVITHLDCDGITSGSIVTKSLIRSGAKCTVRTVNEFSKNLIEKMKSDSRQFHIITDLGGGFAKDIDNALDDNWIVVDHHQIPQEEFDNQRVINAWKYDIDGGKDVSAGGMAYLVSNAIHKENTDLAWIAVVAALGDRQDQGEKKSFTGINLDIASAAKKDGQVEIDLDILLVGRETRPLPDALAFTSQPFIEGLTWNRDACLSLLNSSGIKLKDGSRWRVPAELTEDEKRTLLQTISKYISTKNASDILDELVGYTYTLSGEDKRSFLRDAREFSTMLNSCGRIRKAGVGVSICMGDRTKMLQEGENILVEYRTFLRTYMNTLSSERWRITDNGQYLMVNGEGLVPENMTGAVSSLLGGSQKNTGKIIILRTNGEEGTIKFSSRKSTGCKSDVNLGLLMRECAAKVSGVGGGHAAAAGARITKDKLDEFLDHLEKNVTRMQNSSISE
ncbi:Phosphoesterase DHHA1 [Nitrosotalea sinensis]|uniref:Phosphoesterase DHHA1 n=1 Tax=Nitrosotalea sinensis TaxID=1499975 RepID=A0A2H1EGY6_9ARCH|nr:DHH family phosphoesterase [Candidatus Nitrosotalea sinensis]SHO44613.1 Phosphoesterase DHHA1 [Candidatus Nitrosotalea sinensis]